MFDKQDIQESAKLLREALENVPEYDGTNIAEIVRKMTSLQERAKFLLEDLGAADLLG